MAIATTLSTSAVGYSIYSQMDNLQTSTAQDPHSKVVYASDGTHITALLGTRLISGSYPTRDLKIVAVSDAGTAPTTSNAAISSIIQLDAPGGTAAATDGWQSTTFQISSAVNNNQGRAGFAPIAIDTSDNLYIPLASTAGGTYGTMAVYRIAKPTLGWAAWVADGGTTTLSATKLSNIVFSGTGPINNANIGHFYSAHWTNNGYLVFFAGAQAPQTSGFAFVVINASTGAFVGNSGAFNGYNNTYCGVNDFSVPYLGAPGGGFTLFSTSSTTSTGMFSCTIWQVDNTGVINLSNQSFGSTILGTTVSYTNGGPYANAAMIGWVDTNKFFLIGKNNSSPYAMVATIIQVSWGSADNRPGVNSTPGSFTILANATTNSNTGTGANLPQGWNGQAQVFPEERIIRVFQTSGSTVYYQDINYNSGFNTITYEALPFILVHGTGSKGALQTIFDAAWDNTNLYYYLPSASGSTTIGIYYEAQNANRAITYSVPSTGPVGSASIISPTTSINATSGVGITVVPSITSSGGGHGTFYWGRFTPKTTGYKLKRVNGATTDYLVSSSGTFSTETTNSVSTTANTTVLTTANQWANGTTYAVSFATASNVGTVPYGTTRNIVTTTPSAAPSSPTPRRFFRGTLVAGTLVHEQTFDNNALVNRINVANKGTSATTFGLQIADVYVVAPTTINVGETLVVDTSQRVDAGDRTYLTAGASSTLDVYISGTEGI